MRLVLHHRAPAHVQHRSQRGKTGGIVHHDATGKIQHAPLGQQAIRTPDHVDKGEVNQHQPAGKKQEIRLHCHPVGKSTGNQRRSDDGKHHLVRHMHDQRNTCVIAGVHGVEGNAMHEGVVSGVADNAMPAWAKAHGIPEGKPQHRGPAQRHEALGHDGQHILAAHQSTVKESQPRRHQHDQAGTQQHEAGVAHIKWRDWSSHRTHPYP